MSTQLKDSGNRRAFDTGAVRDMSEDKGRFDLIALKQLAELFEFSTESIDDEEVIMRVNVVSKMLRLLSEYIYGGNKRDVYAALEIFSQHIYDDAPDDAPKTDDITRGLWLLSRAAGRQMEDGANKYGVRNWEKGIPSHVYLDSGIRHLIKWMDGWQDEPHDRATVWNLMGMLWTVEHYPELNDLPFTG